MNNFNDEITTPSYGRFEDPRNMDIITDEFTKVDLTDKIITSKESDEIIQPTTSNGFNNTSNSNHEETVPSLSNFSPSPQDSPLINSSDNEQYLNNTFFNDDKLRSIHDSDHLFDLTPDQQQAFRELELRKQTSEYDDDYDFSLNYEDVPEYDVREKLQTLNAQLANEPLPPDPEHRNSKVAFKNEIVSLVAPAEDYDQSESEHEDTSYTTGISGQSPLEVDNDGTYISPILASESIGHETATPCSAETDIKADAVHLNTEENNVQVISENINEDVKENEDMVVSRGGKFQLMGADEIIDGSNHLTETDDEKSFNDEEVNHLRNRPISAPASKRKFKESGSSPISSLNSRSNSLLQKQNTNLNMQIPRVDKDALRRKIERKKKEEDENMRREEEQQNIRKEMNTMSFNAWLQTKQKHKKEEDERKRKEEEEEQNKKEKVLEERKTIAEEKEKELNRKLEQDRKKEDKLKQYRLKEIQDSIRVHTADERNKAYRDWLKKKHKDYQNKVKEERQRARITRLAMRQCRKSQNLVQAIQQSTSFRYLDFCGYP